MSVGFTLKSKFSDIVVLTSKKLPLKRNVNKKFLAQVLQFFMLYFVKLQETRKVGRWSTCACNCRGIWERYFQRNWTQLPHC